MKTVIQEIQERLSECKKLRYVAENWGQLEFENPPLIFPCVLIDVTEIDYTQNLRRSQQAKATLTVNIANKVGQNVSLNSSPASKKAYYDFYDIFNEVSSLLHGYAAPGVTPMQRISMHKLPRQDGIKECRVTFTFSYTEEL